MTTLAFWYILFSVILHVSWNLISKATCPSVAFYLLTSLVAALATAPFLGTAHIVWSELPGSFWWYFAWSCAANIVYYSGLFLTYKRSDISLAYPLMRALPVLFTAVVTIVFRIGKTPSTMALAGMVIVIAGCLLMPLAAWGDFRFKNYCTSVMGSILMSALGTTGYTIFDNLAIPLLMEHAAGSKITACGAYMAMLEIAIVFGLTPFMFVKEEQRAMRFLWRHSFVPYVSGIFTAGAYLLILLALPMITNVRFVPAFRQMGLPLGVFAGVVFLRERCSKPRLAGMTAIVTGLVIIAFA